MGVDEDGDEKMGGGEGERKTSVIFPAGSMMNTLKMLTFFRKGPFDISGEFTDTARLPAGSRKELGSWHIALPPQEETKKVKVKARLTIHGTFTIESAQLLEDEEYEEVVKERRELPPEEASPAADPVSPAPEASPAPSASPAPEETAAEGSPSPAPQASPDAAEAMDGVEEKKAEAAAKDEEGGEPEAKRRKTDGDKTTNGHAPSAETNGDAEMKAPEASPETTTAEADEKEAAEKKDEEDAEEASPVKAASPEVEEAPKKKWPRYEWVEVRKKKKRTIRTDVPVIATGRPGLSEAELAKLLDEETAFQVEMREIIECDEKRNDLEAYILNMRGKIDGEYSEFISAGDKEKFSEQLTKTEDWLYDNPDAVKKDYLDKMEDLTGTGDPVVWRHKEAKMRQEWIDAVVGTVKNYRKAAEEPGDKYGHIAPEKLAKITGACANLSTWLEETKAKQESMPKYEKPVLLCAEMEKKNKELARVADEILMEPKPPPPPSPPKEETAEKEDDAEGNDDGDEDNDGDDADDDVGKGDAVDAKADEDLKAKADKAMEVD